MTIKNFLLKGGVYLFANILNSAVPFILMPILTRELSPEEYGIAAMFLVFLGLVNAFVGINVHGAISVQYFQLSKERLSEYVTACMVVLLGSGTLVLLFFLIFGKTLEGLIGLPYEWMFVGVLISILQFVITLQLTLWLASGAAIKYGFLQVSNTVLNAGASIVFVVLIGLTWQGRVLGQAVAIFAFGCLSLWLLWSSGFFVRTKFLKKDIRDALRFGLPLVPHIIGAFLMISVDRFIIKNELGLGTVGVYMVAFQLGQSMEVISNAYNKVYAPWLMRSLSDESFDKNKLVKYSYVSFFVLIVIGLLASIVVYFLAPFLLSSEFIIAIKIVPYMCIGFSLTGCYYVVTNFIFFKKQTKWLALITFFCGLVNFPLTYFFISINGVLGAAEAFLLIQLLFFSLTWILSAKVFPLPWLYFLKRS